MTIWFEAPSPGCHEESQADDPLGVALAVLAHELRNPLSAIGLAADVLERHVQDDKRCEALLDAIACNVSLAARLVEDLMQHSKLSSHTFELERSACSLHAQIQQWTSIALRQMKQTARPIIVQAPSGDVRINIDRMRMQQVFVNLIANALRYTPEPGRIWITATVEGPEVIVQVADEGVGIEQARLERLFAQRLPRLTGSKLGLGIGLGVVNKMVQMHGGSVRAHSEGTNRGSQFTVRFPKGQ